MSDEPRQPTIYDVARAAGVAPSTVSRTFSRPGRVNADTAARVRAAAEELGYRANAIARALHSGKTQLLAIAVADVTNPFFFDVIRGAETAASEEGYTMLVADVQESPVSERRALDRILPLVDGLILATSRLSDSAIRVAAKQRPTVVLNRVMSDVASVATDNSGGTRHAVEHLASLGHRQITYLAGPEASWADGMRWRALREACHRLEITVRRTSPSAPTREEGRRAAARFLENPTTAVIAYNDLLAIGFGQELVERGIEIPGAVSVVGFDDIFGADFCNPPLTTVASPLRALGAHAVRTLLKQVTTHTPRLPPPAKLPMKLVVRGSTTTAPARPTDPVLPPAAPPR
ncbi:LacI family DNA-binding transcriptional regulator [Paraoerskovia marina]|uniref:LacI family DNA-binding transcriptional regulator n=1 Tax=Paraoerskovia marina TaxID=545619 RepID=UPI000694FF4B|nr:LacI family DNA-binding transcriptional regulator [Paraoerskovia marina]